MATMLGLGEFLPRGLCRHAVSVRLSVCLSRSWIMSKRIHISSNFFSPSGSHAILVFFHAKRHSNIPTGTPLTGASNAVVSINRDKFCKRGNRWTPPSRKLLHIAGVYI